MLKSSVKVLSLASFVLAVPALIVVDWFYAGYGVLVMFVLATIGLVLDRIVRMNYPSSTVVPITNYRINKLLGIIALVLFAQSFADYGYGFAHRKICSSTCAIPCGSRGFATAHTPADFGGGDDLGI